MATTERKRKRETVEEENATMETEQNPSAPFAQINPAQLQATNPSKRKPKLQMFDSFPFQDHTDGFRKIPIPAHRYTPLKEQWMKVYSPIVEYLHLQIRFNLRTRCVEIKTSDQTEDIQSLQKAGKKNSTYILFYNLLFVQLISSKHLHLVLKSMMHWP